MTSPIERAREAAAKALLAELREQSVDVEDDGFPHVEIGAYAINIRPAMRAAIDALFASLAAEGMVLVPKATLESLSWQYDASHMIYFCPWCQQTGSAEPAVHSPDCGLAAMIAAASQGEGT